MGAPLLDVTVGRVPVLSIDVARRLYAVADPCGAACALIRRSANAEAAIMHASPPLHAALAAAHGARRAPADRVALAAFAYAIRMATRCAPLGLLASTGVVETGPSTTLGLAPGRRACATPTVRWLLRVLGAARGSEPAGSFIANDLVVARDGRLHAYHGGRVTTIRSNAGVAWVRAAAAEERELDELVAAVAQRFAAGSEIARSLVRKLIEAAILVPVRPSLLGDPAAFIRSLAEMSSQARALGALHTELQVFAEAAIGPDALARADASVRSVHAIDGPALQLDAFHTFTGTLGDTVARDVTLLGSIALAHGPPPLHDAVRRFSARYGADRFIPLLDLVHDGFTIEPDAPAGAAPPRNVLLARLVAEAIGAGRREIVLDEATLCTLLPNFEPYRIAHASEVGFRIAARGRDAIAAGDYTIVASYGTCSDGVAKTAGRVIEALGPSLARRVEDAHDAESDGGTLAAELEYVPLDAHDADDLVRPAWHPYAVAESSLATPAMRISPADVTIGIEGGRFVAYARSRCKRLRLNESHRVGAGDAPPHARILAAIAKQDRAVPRPWAWGAAAERMPFLPRVRYGRLVLAPARWTLPVAELDGERFERTRAAHDLPRWVYLGDGAMKLLLDLDAPVAHALLRDRIASGGEDVVRFVEMLPSFDDLWLDDPGGERYAHELVATLAASVPPLRHTRCDPRSCARAAERATSGKIAAGAA